MKSIFEQEVDNLGLVLNKKQKEQFDQYYNLLIEWNKVMNLTAITDYDQVNLKHFTDSLTIVKVISMEKNGKYDRCRNRCRISGNTDQDHVSSSESGSSGFLK